MPYVGFFRFRIEMELAGISKNEESKELVYRIQCSLLQENQGGKMSKRRSIIFIHGIGDQQPGYSEALFDTLVGDNENLRSEILKYEMLYDYVHQEMNAKLEIEKLVKKFTDGKDVKKLAEDTVTHVLYFWMVNDARKWILRLFEQKLLKVVSDGRKAGVPPAKHEISIISHSLGTFIAYEGLHFVIGRNAVGIHDEVHIKNLFTLASPLALIKRINDKLQRATGLLAIAEDLKKPVEWNDALNTQISNIERWYSFRHKLDPVASVEVLKGPFLDANPFVFKKFHSGANAHDFNNYMTQFRGFILEKIMEE